MTIDGAEIYGNKTQGVKIEGATDTIVKNSTIYNNSQGSTATTQYDEINIRLRDDRAITGNTYYSTGTQIIGSTIDPEKSRSAIREEPTNVTGNPSGTVITDTTTDGIPTDGADTFPGTAGADTMAGGKGNDTYTVNHTGDVVIENANEGTDHILSSIKFILKANDNIENLTLTGGDNINGYGNELNNLLTGNSGVNSLEGGLGHDTLDGGAGADTLVGEDGNDVYYVDNENDVIIEKFSGGLGGNDTAYVSSNFALSFTNDEVETLILTGSENLSVKGGSKANTIIGNAGNNTIDGRGGIDTMSGGAGDDIYFVDHTSDFVNEFAGEGIDTIISSVSISAAKPLVANVENLELVDFVADPADPTTACYDLNPLQLEAFCSS